MLYVTLMFMSITKYHHCRLHETCRQPKNDKKYNKDYIGLLELLQTIRGKQDSRDFDQKTYYGLWTDEK